MHQASVTDVTDAAHAAVSEYRRPWGLLAVLGAAQAMLIVDLTVLNVALPTIALDLGLDRASLTWVATVYTLFFGSLLLLGGRVADALGRRTTFLGGLAIFTGASLASGLGGDATSLILARIGQGIGAALLSPAALSIVTTTFNGPDRTRALALWGSLGGIGAVAGVVLGGVLTETAGWPWVFYINVPVGLAVGLAVLHVVPPDRPGPPTAPLDLPGAAAVTGAVGLLLYGLVSAGDAGWTSSSVLAPIGVAALAGAAFVLIERRTAQPLLPLGLVARPPLPAAIHILLVFAALLGGTTFLGSLYAQRVLGLTALETGFTFVPFALGVIAGSQAAAHALGHLGPHRVASGGLLIAAAGAALLARIPAQGDVVFDLLPGLVLIALGLGATVVAGSTSAFTDVTASDAGVTAGLVNTSHEIGFALGVSVLSTIAGASLAADPAAVVGYQSAFLAVAVVAAGVAIVAWRSLPPGAPTGAVGHFAH